MIGVAEQRKGQGEFFRKFPVALHRVGADPGDGAVDLLKGGRTVREVLDFLGSPGSIVLDVEKEYQPVSSEIFGGIYPP